MGWRTAECIALSFALAACGEGGTTGMFAPDFPGSDAARQQTSAGGESGDAVADELTLAYQDAQSVCFDTILRAQAQRDARLSDASVTCTSAGESAEASIESEQVSVYDYDDDGELADVVTEGITADAYAGASFDAAESGNRVVERAARLCCAVPASTRVELRIDGAAGGTLDLTWAAD